MLNEILFDNRLSDKQKLLFCYVSSLCAEKWYCWATNKYIWDNLNATANTISTNLSKLNELWYINISIENWFDRKIKLLGVIKNQQGGCWKINRGGIEKSIHNNTSIILQDNNNINITKSKDFDTKKRVDIDLLINDIRWLCNELWVAYNKDKDRMFWKHIIEWVEFGKFCDDIKQTRIEFAKNVLKASLKINYWKWVCSWPKLIYQNYSDVYNQTKLRNKKTTEQSRVAFIPSIYQND
jgi:hypothetical protein